MQEELQDPEVVSRVLNGERGLFELLMRRHNPLVYRTIRGVIRDDSEVEDVMQEAYVAAFTHLSRFRSESRFSTWLVRIAINAALQRLRKRGEQVDLDADALPEPAQPPSSSPETQAMVHEASKALERAVNELPPSYRMVFILREVEGLSTAEVADALKLSEENVKQRLHRGKAQLRETLYAQVGEHAREAFSFPATRCDRVVAHVLRTIE